MLGDDSSEKGRDICKRNWIASSHFEGDSEMVIKVLQKGDMLFSSFGHIVRETLIHVSSLRSFSYYHTVRQGNVMVHALAQRTRLSFPLLVWMETVS